MATIPAQRAVAEYHAEISHHGGHEMFQFHGQWHIDNRDPTPPPRRDRNWGRDLGFGTNFLQMHHEMVKAADDEPKLHMNHASLVSWYLQKDYDVPEEWGPLTPIPEVLRYVPDLAAFPEAIQARVRDWAASEQQTPEQFLRRRTEQPNFELPRYFTRDGVGPDEPGEPYTGARKLADFQNTNQLGCCLVFPHNRWHGAIGGAMLTFWTAIADPIFYWGVHWHVDKVFDEYKIIQAENRIRRLDRNALLKSRAVPDETLPLLEDLSEGELRLREADIELSRALRRDPVAA
jgi:hypothetical protein